MSAAPTQQQRAFAQKLNKQGAAEVRKAVSSTIYSTSDLTRCASGLNLTVPLTDVVDPPDYEEFVLQNSCTVERDPFRDLILYPEDDVDVHSMPRKCRTVKPIVPELGPEADEFVFDLARRYTADYTVITRRYHRYSSSVCSKEKLSGQDATIPQEYEVDIEDAQDDEDDINKRQSIHMNSVPRGSWASSIFDLKSSQGDQLLPHLFDQVSYEQIDEDNRKCRQENREDTLFSLFPGEEEEDLIERRPSAPFPQEHFGHRIVVKCIQLKLELDFEPLFATVALYDAKEKKKISENFYFDVNQDEQKKMISMHIQQSDVSTMSRAACFSITYPSPDVFLVIRLEKVLQQGDIGDCAEPYMREDKAKEDRLKSNAVQFCERLGKYRMPFAWTAIYLMNIVTGATGGQDAVKTCEPEPSRSSSLDRRSMSGIPGQFDSFRRRNKEEFSSTRRGSMERGRSERRGLFSGEDYGPSLDNFRPVTLTVSSFFKQEGDRLSDEDLYKFLADLKRPSSVLKRVKCIPGTLKLDISPCPEEPRYMLTPELYKVEPYPDEKTRPTREILEFPSREIYNPHTVYRNLLYVYPRSLNFSNRQGSARNLAVKVQFMSGEEEGCALKAIFGKSNCPELSREAYTAVTYHNKSPDFYEEIKVKLPAKLTDAHHLLFTFYHISCQSKKNESGPVEVPVGYTWLPLCREGKLMIDDFSIPVSVDKLPPSYSILFPDEYLYDRPTNLPNMKWVDHKGLFNVSLRSMSSVHTQDDKLEKFLYNCRMTLEQKLPPRRTESQFENDLRLSIQDIPKSKGENLVQFLPLVLDRLLYLMVRPPILGGQQVNIGQPAFEGIILVVKRVHELLCDKNDRNGRNLTLASYIQYCCTLPHPGPLQHCATDPMLGSGYNTLGRPSSLPVSNKNFPRSSSNPDLNALTPTSPDNEISAILGGTKYLDRTGSMRADDFNQPQMVRNRAKKLVHEELVLQWLVLSGQNRDHAFAYSWFLFELIIKSMAEHLNKTQKLDTPRQMRFNDKPFVEDIEALMNLVNKEVTDKYIKEPQIIRSLNISLGFFLHDLLSFMDRGFVFNLIANYCGAIAEKIQTLSDSTTLMLLRLDFLRIVCSHEHYFPLNLPFGTPLTPTSGRAASPTPSIQSTNSMSSYTSTSTLTDRGQFYELTLQYRQQHFLVGLVLSDLKVALDTHNPIIHHKAINVVRNLLYNHDLDLRYMDTAMKSRLAALYMPIIGIVIEALPQLSDPGLDLRRHTSCPEEEEADKISHSVALEIAGATVFAGRVQEYPGGMDEPKSKKSPLTTECTRNLLICFLWVIKNADESVVRQWWSELNVNVLAQILDVLYFCISNFEYKGKKSIAQCSKQTIQKSVDMKSRLEEAILGNLNARTEMMLRRRQTSYSQMAGDNGQMSSQGDSRLRWRKDQINYKPSLDQTESVKPRNVEADAHTEGSLAAEISMVALDTLELIIQIARSMEYTPLQSNALRILLHSLSLNQSTSVLKNMFATQRALVTRFLDMLFVEETEQCADLCLRLLRHCSSLISQTRSQASASLYMLMRQNYDLDNNFARVKMQVTMSLSKLVGQNQNFSEESLRRSLKTILTYAEEDADLAETPFTEQVKDLVFNLHMILSDTVKMKEFQEDPEMLLDLMYRIAKGYQNSPDLRLTWLHTMATKHSERNNHAEAAHCLVHAAGLIAEYLYMIEDKPYLPVGAVDFQKISVNVLEESAVSDDVVSPEEGVCTGKYFTENGLVGVLEAAAMEFNMAGMYEHVNEVYKILIPIHESGRDYKKLGAIHNKLHEAFSNITRQASKRMFGTYFRVGFYGHKFGDLDGEEFVYKEPPITKLPEVAHRLEGFYSDRFGEGVVHIVKDSNPVDRESLDSAKAYIQITYVEPYFDLYEYRTKVTYFERNNNIKRFVFATPFTQDGRAHGEIHEQHKRKTILTTSHMFPYIKTRLQVISHDQVLLTPIEVAIEDIQKKTKELAVALYQEPPDTKILQMVLQGCIGTTVNQGPVEVAVVFLKDSPENKSQDVRHRNKLRLSFKDFLKKCSDALHKNKFLISSDQKEYQRELERNYHSVRDKLLPYISSNLATLKTKHHRRGNKESPSKHKSSGSSKT
ncbi:dedicator of cytokinesis protein 7-like isoform X3 [Crassostrea angulata]|uniref:dedicator of cytokinesis protein 7-like isoform X3 n=1 Tax=Magallana angulata TaxID=2784310 RepID=UPI0022B19B2F|nr:dedicator of cytokinesis protein 7-like isoform X3 [Crassostrea angulata]